MLIIPNVEIDEHEIQFVYAYDSEHINKLKIAAYVTDGRKFTFDIDNFHLLTKCAIIDLCYKKVEACLK